MTHAAALTPEPNTPPELTTRTTPLAPKDSSLSGVAARKLEQSLPQFEQKTVVVSCDQHGTQEAIIFKGWQEWNNAECPECVKERKQRQAEEDARRAAAIVAERKRRDLDARLMRSGIKSRYHDKRLDDYIPQNDDANVIHAWCREYVRQFPTMQSLGRCIIMCGKKGVGKTHLAASIVNEVVRQHDKVAVYLKAIDAFDMVKETFRKDSKKSEREAVKWFVEPDLLVLDEIGVQYGTDTEQKILFRIIDLRYEEMKPTILISNLAIPAFTEFVGERVVDRMRENGGMLFAFDWESYRGKA